ncbi:hypothetical protein [Streptomyces sp. WAC06614]|uniref:hypothetical protein n=1 Tax=Streptomyces sp. WAC06614 TaxID=2487416 RepID=UPI000F76C591|nr:hypothetical protein [Streptomyces sp. WAC06614]RSS67372.1 hypothetical protein EF918_28765 [Streptomyces sp. WAC06614]
MSDIQALVEELTALPRTRPAGRDEAEAMLARLRSAAARWADVLYEAGRASEHLPPRAEAAVMAAFHRAEQAYVELEIAVRDCGEHRDPVL